jgi:selenoprotein W-related protein
LSGTLANALKQNMTEISLAPYGDGRFEVIVDDEKIYSKLDTGEFPDEKMILKKIKTLA